MRILFHPAPSPHAVRATFPLARGLVARGHTPVYAAVEDLRDGIAAQGFESFALHAEVLPHGTLAHLESLADISEWQVAWSELNTSIAADYFSGAVSRQLAAARVDLAIADAELVSPVQFALHALRIPCLQWMSALAPPTSESGYLDDQGARWLGSCLNERVASIRSGKLIATRFDHYACAFGFPAARIFFGNRAHPQLRGFANVTAAARALDVVNGSTDDVRYLGLPCEPATCAVDASQSDFVSAAVATGSPLLYASLGDAPQRHPHGAQFIAAFIAAMAARPTLRSVLYAGRSPRAGLLPARLPSNVFIADEDVRDWILPRAAAYLTDAGLDALRAAVFHAVPLIAVPQTREQTGNAARIAALKLGNRLPPELVNAGTLGMSIDRALAEAPGTRSRLARVNADSHASDTIDRAVEQVLALAPAPALAAIDAPAIFHHDGQPVAQQVAAQTRWRFTDTTPTNTVTGTPCYPTLTQALANATGPILSSFDPGHDTPLWSIDASEVLVRHAHAWATRVLVADAAETPARAAHFAALLREKQALRTSSPPPDLWSHAWQMLSACAPYWHRGYGAIAMAAHALPHRAAHLAGLEARAALARRAAGAAAGSDEGAARFNETYRSLTIEFDSELTCALTARRAAA